MDYNSRTSSFSELASIEFGDHLRRSPSELSTSTLENQLALDTYSSVPDFGNETITSSTPALVEIENEGDGEMFGQKIIALVSQISEMKLEPMKKLACTSDEILKYFKRQDEVKRELEHAKRLLKNLPVSIEQIEGLEQRNANLEVLVRENTAPIVARLPDSMSNTFFLKKAKSNSCYYVGSGGMLKINSGLQRLASGSIKVVRCKDNTIKICSQLEGFFNGKAFEVKDEEHATKFQLFTYTGLDFFILCAMDGDDAGKWIVFREYLECENVISEFADASRHLAATKLHFISCDETLEKQKRTLRNNIYMISFVNAESEEADEQFMSENKYGVVYMVGADSGKAGNFKLKNQADLSVTFYSSKNDKYFHRDPETEGKFTFGASNPDSRCAKFELYPVEEQQHDGRILAAVRIRSLDNDQFLRIDTEGSGSSKVPARIKTVAEEENASVFQFIEV